MDIHPNIMAPTAYLVAMDAIRFTAFVACAVGLVQIVLEALGRHALVPESPSTRWKWFLVELGVLILAGGIFAADRVQRLALEAFGGLAFVLLGWSLVMAGVVWRTGRQALAPRIMFGAHAGVFAAVGLLSGLQRGLL